MGRKNGGSNSVNINTGLKVKVENVAVVTELSCASEFNLLAYHNVL